MGAPCPGAQLVRPETGHVPRTPMSQLRWDTKAHVLRLWADALPAGEVGAAPLQIGGDALCFVLGLEKDGEPQTLHHLPGARIGVAGRVDQALRDLDCRRAHR